MRRRGGFRGLLGPLLVAVAALVTAGAAPSPTPSASPGVSPNALSITVVGAVTDSEYPDVGLVVSIVDVANGRPENALNASNVTPDQPAAGLAVSQSSEPLPTAYVLVLDTSGSMADATPDRKSTYMERAKSLAASFLGALGPKDQVDLVTFSSSLTATGWRAAGDKALTDAIAAIKAPKGTTHVSAALIAASGAASQVPAGVLRRAVVLITDASSADKDANLTPEQMRSKLGPPTFIVGVREIAAGSAEAANLQNVAAITGGSFEQDAANADPAEVLKPVFDSASLVWTVHLRTEATPDGKSHAMTLGFVDAQQRAGSVTFSYQAGKLGSVTPISAEGLADGDNVTTDRSVRFSSGGSRTWAHTQFELYVDCEPSGCNPAVTVKDGALTWPLAVGPLRQGAHKLVVRLEVTDDSGASFGPEDLALSFTRSGTTWNIAATSLVGGIALLAIGAVFIASRRRRMPGPRRNR